MHRCKAPSYLESVAPLRSVLIIPLLSYRMYNNISARSLIPLPDPNASPNSAAHPSQYPELRKGTVVLALYPDTTAFYRAEVVATPRDTLVAGLRVHIILTAPYFHSD